MSSMARHWQLTLGEYANLLERVSSMSPKERLALLSRIEYEQQFEVEVLQADVEITSCDPNEGLTDQAQ